MRSLRAETVNVLLQRLRDVASSDPAATQLGRSLLAPLAREDLERGNNLVATLRAYYACGARVDRTADNLFLHRNSVRYRLDRVRSLLALDIDQPHVIAALTIALASAAAAHGEHEDAG
jgi:DNA-binding PucR family transcriptional regulator